MVDGRQVLNFCIVGNADIYTHLKNLIANKKARYCCRILRGIQRDLGHFLHGRKCAKFRVQVRVNFMQFFKGISRIIL